MRNMLQETMKMLTETKIWVSKHHTRLTTWQACRKTGLKSCYRTVYYYCCCCCIPCSTWSWKFTFCSKHFNKSLNLGTELFVSLKFKLALFYFFFFFVSWNLHAWLFSCFVFFLKRQANIMSRPWQEFPSRRPAFHSSQDHQTDIYAGPEEYMEVGTRGFLVNTLLGKEEVGIDDAIDLLRQASIKLYGGIKVSIGIRG